MGVCLDQNCIEKSIVRQPLILLYQACIACIPHVIDQGAIKITYEVPGVQLSTSFLSCKGCERCTRTREQL